MKERCYKVFSKSYDDYGRRGIKVCDEWHSFENFYLWAVANGYNSKLTLERKDNDKGYSPDNCKWATRLEQNRNSRHNRLITAFGETKPLSAWVEDERCNTTKHGLRKRLNRGWNPEEAITSKPVLNQYTRSQTNGL